MKEGIKLFLSEYLSGEEIDSISDLVKKNKITIFPQKKIIITKTFSDFVFKIDDNENKKLFTNYFIKIFRFVFKKIQVLKRKEMILIVPKIILSLEDKKINSTFDNDSITLFINNSVKNWHYEISKSYILFLIYNFIKKEKYSIMSKSVYDELILLTNEDLNDKNEVEQIFSLIKKINSPNESLEFLSEYLVDYIFNVDYFKVRNIFLSNFNNLFEKVKKEVKKEDFKTQLDDNLKLSVQGEKNKIDTSNILDRMANKIIKLINEENFIYSVEKKLVSRFFKSLTKYNKNFISRSAYDILLFFVPTKIKSKILPHIFNDSWKVDHNLGYVKESNNNSEDTTIEIKNVVKTVKELNKK